MQFRAPYAKGLTHWKRCWCWERLKAGEEEDNRGWDGWMASLTKWTWVWVNSGRWWWTGRPGVLHVHGVAKSWIWLSDWAGLNWWKRASGCPRIPELDPKGEFQILPKRWLNIRWEALLSGQLLLTDSMFLRIQDIVLLCRRGTPFCSKHMSSATGLQENLSCLPLINTLNLDACFLPLQNHMRFWRLRKHIFLFYCPSQPGTCTRCVLVDCLLGGAAKSKGNVLPSHNGLFLFLNLHQELHHGFLHGVWVWWVCVSSGSSDAGKVFFF